MFILRIVFSGWPKDRNSETALCRFQWDKSGSQFTARISCKRNTLYSQKLSYIADVQVIDFVKEFKPWWIYQKYMYSIRKIIQSGQAHFVCWKNYVIWWKPSFVVWPSLLTLNSVIESHCRELIIHVQHNASEQKFFWMTVINKLMESSENAVKSGDSITPGLGFAPNTG